MDQYYEVPPPVEYEGGGKRRQPGVKAWVNSLSVNSYKNYIDKPINLKEEKHEGRSSLSWNPYL